MGVSLQLAQIPFAIIYGELEKRMIHLTWDGLRKSVQGVSFFVLAGGNLPSLDLASTSRW
jgi:hypothetical protein